MRIFSSLNCFIIRFNNRIRFTIYKDRENLKWIEMCFSSCFVCIVVWWCLSSSTIFILLAMAIWDSFFSFISTKNKKHHQQHKQTKYSQNTFKLRIRKICIKFFFKKERISFCNFLFFLFYCLSLRLFLLPHFFENLYVFVWWMKNQCLYFEQKICFHIYVVMLRIICIILLLLCYFLKFIIYLDSLIDMNREKKS